MDTIFSTPRSQKALDNEIERLTRTLSNTSSVDPDYAKIADNLKVLCDSRGQLTNSGISAETIVSATVHILGMLLVLNYEKTGVITSKAFSFLGRKV